jgi:predicted dehydrogenase
MSKIRMGVIGVGVISTVHIMGIHKSKDAELVAICDINPEVLKTKGGLYEITESHRFLNHEDLLKCEDVDAVSICTPNNVHFPIARDAIKYRKSYLLEKPITLSYEDAMELKRLTKEANLPHMISFSYRYKSAARYARWLVTNGYLGNIYHIYAQYLQSWGNSDKTPRVWRFVKDITGSGALGDLGSHMLDLTRFLTGREIQKVVAHADTYTHQRKIPESEEIGEVDVDDFCHFLAELEGGVSGVFNITRYGFGRGNYQRVEIYGSKGGLVYKLDENGRGNDVIELCIGDTYGETMDYHETNIPKQFSADQMQSFFDIINGKADGLSATIEDGCVNQLMLDSIVESFENGKWVSIPV